MGRYVLRRVLLMIPILFGVVLIVFTINYFNASSPAYTVLGSAATPENIAIWEHQNGLDRPYLVQLFEYYKNIFVHGDFGTSYIYNLPVMQLIGERIGKTVFIGLMGVVLSVIIGIPLGMLAAVKQYSVFDYGSTFLAVLCSALPNFWISLMLVYLFAVKLRWLPVTGVQSWQGYILPIVSVAIGPIAYITRMTRSSMLEVIRSDYVRTARAKGLEENRVITHHVLKNGLIPVVTVIGQMAGTAMTGTVIVENIFNISGLGLLMYTAITSNDYITTQTTVIVCAFIVTVVNLLADISYAFIDPRIKAQYENSGRKKKIKKADLAVTGGAQA